MGNVEHPSPILIYKKVGARLKKPVNIWPFFMAALGDSNPSHFHLTIKKFSY